VLGPALPQTRRGLSLKNCGRIRKRKRSRGETPPGRNRSSTESTPAPENGAPVVFKSGARSQRAGGGPSAEQNFFWFRQSVGQGRGPADSVGIGPHGHCQGSVHNGAHLLWASSFPPAWQKKLDFSGCSFRDRRGRGGIPLLNCTFAGSTANHPPGLVSRFF